MLSGTLLFFLIEFSKRCNIILKLLLGIFGTLGPRHAIQISHVGRLLAVIYTFVFFKLVRPKPSIHASEDLSMRIRKIWKKDGMFMSYLGRNWKASIGKTNILKRNVHIILVENIDIKSIFAFDLVRLICHVVKYIHFFCFE